MPPVTQFITKEPTFHGNGAGELTAEQWEERATGFLATNAADNWDDLRRVAQLKDWLRGDAVQWWKTMKTFDRERYAIVIASVREFWVEFKEEFFKAHKLTDIGIDWTNLTQTTKQTAVQFMRDTVSTIDQFAMVLPKTRTTINALPGGCAQQDGTVHFTQDQLQTWTNAHIDKAKQTQLEDFVNETAKKVVARGLSHPTARKYFHEQCILQKKTLVQVSKTIGVEELRAKETRHKNGNGNGQSNGDRNMHAKKVHVVIEEENGQEEVEEADQGSQAVAAKKNAAKNRKNNANRKTDKDKEAKFSNNGTEGSNGGYKGTRGNCHLCGEPGHWAPQCPHANEFKKQLKSKKSSSAQEASYSQEDHDSRAEHRTSNTRFNELFANGVRSQAYFTGSGNE